MQKLFAIIILLAFSLNAQNKIITDEQTGNPMLMGYCTIGAFDDTNFSGWFDPEYEMYEPDIAALDIIKDKIEDVEITVIIGTWCSESKEEIPRFFRILDEINYPTDDITIIAVNRDKKTEGDEIKSLAVDFVPTFIFYKNDSELGRIIEVPDQSLELDMLEIITQTELE